MQTTAKESEIYGSMVSAMIENGVLNFRTKDTETMAALGHKGVNIAKEKDVSERDLVDSLFMLAYYRALRIKNGSNPYQLAGREGTYISKVLSIPTPKNEINEAQYTMAQFLLNNSVN